MKNDGSDSKKEAKSPYDESKKDSRQPDNENTKQAKKPDESWLKDTNAHRETHHAQQTVITRTKKRHKRPKAKESHYSVPSIGQEASERHNTNASLFMNSETLEHEKSCQNFEVSVIGEATYSSVQDDISYGSKIHVATGTRMQNVSGHGWEESNIRSKSQSKQFQSINSSNSVCKESDVSVFSEQRNFQSQWDEQRNTSMSFDESSFYEQSCKLYDKEKLNDLNEELSDEMLMKFGIKLNMSFLNKFKNARRLNKPPIFQNFLEDEAQLQEKLFLNPKKYVHCILQMEGAYDAICKPLDTAQTHNVIAITGRFNLGQTFNGDEVVVEIFDNKDPRDTRRYGKVLGVLNRNRDKNIKHPVFICTLDKMNTAYARPVCQTVPIIKLYQKSIIKKPNRTKNFKIEIFTYDERAEILCDSEIIEINPRDQSSHAYLVALINWDPRFSFPLGAIIKMIPWSNNIARGLKILDLQHEVPTFYRKQTVDMVENIIKTIDDHSSDTEDRKDLTTLNTFTIDSEGSLVLDDALSIEQTSDGIKVGVHIADVTAFIKKGTPIDEEAYSRATTFNPGIRQSRYMLPEPLSKKFSLLPNKKRLTISVIFLLGKDGKPKQIENNFQIFLSVICSRRQFTYREVQDIIMKLKTTDGIEKDVKTLHQLAEKVRFNRLGDSMFALDLSDIEETEDDNTLSETPEAHYLVEEFMVMANQKVAQWLHTFYPTCMPVRYQPPPSIDALNNFVQRSNFFIHTLVQLQNRRISGLKDDIVSFESLENNPRNASKTVMIAKEIWEEILKEARVSDPKHGSKYIRADELHPLQHIIYQHWISIQERAEYRCSTQHIASKEIAHYSLEFDIYTHFTSPIRCYNDMIIHRMVRAALARQKCPYEESDIKEMCIHFNIMSSKAKRYHKDCKALEQAKDLHDTPRMVKCFVDEISDKGVTLCSPLMKYVRKTNRQLNFNLLDMGFKPRIDVDKNTEWNYVIATWRKRIYDLDFVPVDDVRENIVNANTDSLSDPKDKQDCVQLNPHKSVVFITLRDWVKMLKYALGGRFRELKRTIESVHLAPECSHGYDDVFTFLSDSQTFEPNIKFTMKFSHGQIVEILMTAEPQQGMLAPKPVLYNMTKNVQLCLQHTDDPVLHLYRYSTRYTCDKYHSKEMYLERWLPLILMESAIAVVQNEESYCINNVSVTFVGEMRGTFLLPLEFCEMRNIEISGISLYDDGDDTNTGNSYDWICLKAMVRKHPNHKNTGVLATHMNSDTMWIGHAAVVNVEKKNDEQNEQTANIVVTFDLHECSATFPDELRKAETKFSIEVLRKPAMDRRTENIIKQLPDLKETLAEKIALNHPMPDLGTKYLKIVRPLKKDLSWIKPTNNDRKHRPLPKNNTKQQEAINKALCNKFTLIQGPPGTGKTHTAIKLIYLFNEVNKLLDENESSRKHVVYCGPSNTSVDLVADWMLRRMGTYCPKFIRVYGRAIEAIDYPVPGCTFLSKRSTRNLQAADELKQVTLHHLIRKEGKPHAQKIKDIERMFKMPNYVHKPLLVRKYIKLVAKASREEISTYDVILCTTMVASSPKVVKATSVNQLIIDEAGMCTEPQCMVPIIATKAEQVVLIGDHMQLRPIIKCKSAGELGLHKSLFERYVFTKSSKNVMFTMLEEQYRMDPKICHFPSNHFYNGKLVTRPGQWDKDKLPMWPMYKGEPYPHVFVHVEGEEKELPVSTEDGNEKSRSNAKEIKQTVKIFKYLIDEGIDYDSINIMSQYNAQCNEIRRRLTELKHVNYLVNTVVSSQGGEWDYVIFSTVRSLPENKIEQNPNPGWCKQNLGFITDHNQINVALTRPRKGLIIIGNKNLLCCDDVWRKLIEDYEQQNCIKTPAVFPPPHRTRQEKMKDATRRNKERYGSSRFEVGQPTSFEGSFDESRDSRFKQHSRASSCR